MSSEHDENADNTILPLKWKPKTNYMNKLLLNDPYVINLIIRSLLGKIAPENSYTVAQNKRADSKDNFTVYIPQNANDDRLIPVFIAIHEEVNNESMLDTIDYCLQIYEEFKQLPTVLIISIKGCSSLENSKGLSIVDNSCLIQSKCNFWAHQCFLFFPDSVNTTHSTNAFIKLCQFMSDPNKTLCFSFNSETQTSSLTCEAAVGKDRLQ